MRTLAQEVEQGLRAKDIEVINRVGDKEKQSAQYKGAFLRNLIGKQGTSAGTVSFLQIVGGETSGPRDQQALAEALNRGLEQYYEVLNLMRAYAFKIGEGSHQEYLLPGFGGWRGFDNTINRGAFVGRLEGPIIPRTATQDEEKVIQQKFDEDGEKAQVIERELTGKDKEKVDEEIRETQAKLDKLKRAKELRDSKESTGKEIIRLEGETSDRTKRIMGIEQTQQQLTQTLGKLRFYQGGRKATIQGSIEDNKTLLEQLTREQSAAQETLKIQNEKVREIEKELQVLQEETERISETSPTLELKLKRLQQESAALGQRLVPS